MQLLLARRRQEVVEVVIGGALVTRGIAGFRDVPLLRAPMLQLEYLHPGRILLMLLLLAHLVVIDGIARGLFLEIHVAIEVLFCEHVLLLITPTIVFIVFVI
jgi:hypothetical protein